MKLQQMNQGKAQLYPHTDTEDFIEQQHAEMLAQQLMEQEAQGKPVTGTTTIVNNNDLREPINFKESHSNLISHRNNNMAPLIFKDQEQESSKGPGETQIVFDRIEGALKIEETNIDEQISAPNVVIESKQEIKARRMKVGAGVKPNTKHNIEVMVLSKVDPLSAAIVP